MVGELDNTTIDVALLSQNGGTIARKLVDYFERNETLINPLRTQLVDLILSDGRRLTRSNMNDIADQICKIFRGEEKRIYYDKQTKQEPTGLLYTRYNKKRSKKALKNSKPKTSSENMDGTPTEFSDSVRASIDYLNNAANSKNVDDILEHWENTFSFRNQQSFAETISFWLPLRD